MRTQSRKPALPKNPNPTHKGWVGDGRVALRAVLMIPGAALLPACTHIITQSTPYYEGGPSQLDPPQGDIEAGTLAMVVGSDGSYVRVVTVTGINAWVWDRAVMSVWDHMQKQDEDKKRREAREKWQKARGGSQPQTAQPDIPAQQNPPAQPMSQDDNSPTDKLPPAQE